VVRRQRAERTSPSLTCRLSADHASGKANAFVGTSLEMDRVDKRACRVGPLAGLQFDVGTWGQQAVEFCERSPPMFRFSIRELMLVTLVVAMGLGWCLDHRLQSDSAILLRQAKEARESRLEAMEGMLTLCGFKITEEFGEKYYRPPPGIIYPLSSAPANSP